MEICEVQSSKSKTLHLVRHAQGIHNVELEENGESNTSYKLFDAHLSSEGFIQAYEQRQQMKDTSLLNTIELVVTSPLRRTLQTTMGIFREQEDEINKSDEFPKPPIIALEICRERLGLFPCDSRENISIHRTCFPEIDFTLIESEEDNLWKADVREAKESVATRGLQLLKWLWERPEKEIAIVSHGIFLQQTLIAFHDKLEIPLQPTFLTRFANCELRSVQIEESDMERVKELLKRLVINPEQDSLAVSTLTASL